jgi:hypothetical protein
MANERRMMGSDLGIPLEPRFERSGGAGNGTAVDSRIPPLLLLSPQDAELPWLPMTCSLQPGAQSDSVEYRGALRHPWEADFVQTACEMNLAARK